MNFNSQKEIDSYLIAIDFVKKIGKRTFQISALNNSEK